MAKQQLPPPPTPPPPPPPPEGSAYILGVLKSNATEKEKMKLLKDWAE